MQRHAEEAAVGTTQLVGQFAEEAQTEDWLSDFRGGCFRGVEVGVPEQSRRRAVLLTADKIDGLFQFRELLLFGGLQRLASLRLFGLEPVILSQQLLERF